MFNFKTIFEAIFKSFVVARDIEMVDRLAAEWHEVILLIKRSWLYGVASGIWLIPLLGFAGANVFLIFKHFEGSTFGIILATLVAVTILGTLYASVKYLFDYRRSYWQSAKVMRSEDLRTNLTLGDKSFTTCFNQLQFNFFFFIGVVVIYILHIILVSKFSTGIWAAIDIACIAAQMVFIQKFVRLLIDLEMDFNLVVPGKIFFVNQQGLYSDIQTLEADKIKTIKSSYPSFFASFFHYGTIEVLTEGDESNIGHTTTEFVDRPEETVVNINSLLSGRYTLTEQIHSAYLQKVLSGFPGLPPEERKAKIKEYLTTYESQIKKEYLESQDTEMKERVEQLYREHYTK